MNSEPTDGQGVKSKNFSKYLIHKYREKNVKILDTNLWKKNPLLFFLNYIKLFNECENIVIMPAQNGIKVLLPVGVILKKLFNKKVHYVVIGGWLPEFLKNHSFLKKYVKYMDSIHVETYSMIEKLKHIGFEKCFYMPNFKYIKTIDLKSINNTNLRPYNLCTFSRVSKSKGIEDAINAVKLINEKYKEKIVTLDIYGRIEDEYLSDFKIVVKENSEYVKYKGEINANNSVDVLKNYFLLMFPTFYEGEGFAGTILDGFAAGLPIIASKWKYNSELIKNGENGFLHDVNDIKQISEQIDYCITNSNVVNEIKVNNLKKYTKYTPEKVMNQFLNNIQMGDEI